MLFVYVGKVTGVAESASHGNLLDGCLRMGQHVLGRFNAKLVDVIGYAHAAIALK